MLTVPEFELEQRISDFVHFVKDFASKKEGDFTISAKRDKALLMCINGEVNLEFEV